MRRRGRARQPFGSCRPRRLPLLRASCTSASSWTPSRASSPTGRSTAPRPRNWSSTRRHSDPPPQRKRRAGHPFPSRRPVRVLDVQPARLRRPCAIDGQGRRALRQRNARPVPAPQPGRAPRSARPRRPAPSWPPRSTTTSARYPSSSVAPTAAPAMRMRSGRIALGGRLLSRRKRERVDGRRGRSGFVPIRRLWRPSGDARSSRASSLRLRFRLSAAAIPLPREAWPGSPRAPSRPVSPL